MTRKETTAATHVMIAFAGGVQCQYRLKSPQLAELGWCDFTEGSSVCTWNWSEIDYRIKPSPREFWLCPALIGFQFSGMAAEGVAKPDERFIKVREVLE